MVWEGGTMQHAQARPPGRPVQSCVACSWSCWPGVTEQTTDCGERWTLRRKGGSGYGSTDKERECTLIIHNEPNLTTEPLLLLVYFLVMNFSNVFFAFSSHNLPQRALLKRLLPYLHFFACLHLHPPNISLFLNHHVLTYCWTTANEYRCRIHVDEDVVPSRNQY